ncbi:MAG: Flp family type IVb pilin [Abitibacteriaceae bacterium]|nr:Flp family type IVb pilin [Abditibacteriaceae bacterium]MBV9865347.1 Flp family type IVb pilin [Abditibacteriaceae bacterium]
MIQRLWREEEGQSLVEYGLLVSLICLVTVAVMTIMGRALRVGFSLSADKLSSTT